MDYNQQLRINLNALPESAPSAPQPSSQPVPARAEPRLVTLTTRICRALFLVSELFTLALIRDQFSEYGSGFFHNDLVLIPILALPFLSVLMLVLQYWITGVIGLGTTLTALLYVATATAFDPAC
jgi:hypothetical protein